MIFCKHVALFAGICLLRMNDDAGLFDNVAEERWYLISRR